MLAGGSNVVTDSTNDTNTDNGDGDTGDGGGDDGQFEEQPQSECFDGIDNDGDGLIDEEDPECDPSSPNYNEMEA